MIDEKPLSFLINENPNTMVLLFIRIATVLFQMCDINVIDPYNDSLGSKHSNGGQPSPNLIYEETFEGKNSMSTAVNIQKSTSYGFTITDSIAFEGSNCARIELRYGDPIAHNGTRAEIYVIDRISHNERWYSFALYVPSNGYKYDSSNEVISQWHQGGSPALSLRAAKDRFYVRTLPLNKLRKWKNIDLGEIVKDTWNEFVIHVVHSGKPDGLIEIWRDGIKVVTHKGPNNYDEKKLPYWKVGVYKAIWNNRPTAAHKRVLYIDNIRVGNSNASLEEMSSYF